MPQAPPGRAALLRMSGLAAVSGGCGLVYESLWMRSLGLVFGNTTDAVAVALAVFMGGLALGSIVAARRPAAAPLRAYARVEIGIALTALVTLPLLRALPPLYAALAGRAGLDGPLELLGRILVAAAVLLPTTALLGATVPLLVESLDRRGVGVREGLGGLYLANTLGGAAGIFLATFVLVPGLGLRGSMVAAAVSNLLVGMAARRWSREAPDAAPAARGPDRARRPPAFAGLAAASGAFTFGIEVLWTRSFALVIGSSVYAFNLMLLAVLLGLAAGTALYARLRPRLTRPARALGALLAGAGAAALLGVVVIGTLPGVFLALMATLPTSFAAYQSAAFGLCLLTMLPVTMALGLSFPLLTHLVEAEAGAAQETTGWLYGWNTLGAIVGALATDLLLVGRLGLQQSYLVLAALPLAAGAWALTRGASRPLAWRAAAAVAPLVLLAALFPWWRPWDPAVMTAGVYRYGLEWRERPGFRLADLASERRQLFYREGREAVVAVSERLGTSRRFLSVNGKTDAGSAPEDVLTQRFIAHVPLLLHAAPRRVLVIGWGAGATAAAAALYPVERLECVEIEPATFEAAPLFEELSGAVRRDPRFRIVFRDGRNHLLRGRERWDVIVSEPSNPWISGVANLFTREFYETARARLGPGGLFGQWFHYYNMEPADVKVELATFAASFPYVSVWLVPPLPPEAGGLLTADLLLVGSAEPHGLDWPRLAHAFRETPVGADLKATRAVRDELVLAASYAFGRDDLLRFVAAGAPPSAAPPLNTDDTPWIEFQAPRRNIAAPADVARLAREMYVLLGEAGESVLPPLAGHPGLAAGGRAAADLHVDLAERWLEAGLPGRARRALDRAVVLGPDDERAWEAMGGAAIDAREWGRAEEAHRALLRLRPRDVDATLRLAAVLARQSKWAESEGALRRAREIDPRAPVDPALAAYVEAHARPGGEP